jgi:hypothetical protein
VYERKQQMRDKYLMEPLSWIIGTIMRELNFLDLIGNPLLDELHDHHDTMLV